MENTPNTISKEDKDYYISYLSNVKAYGNETTCLHINSTKQFLILNGDHKKEFNKCNTLKESLKYFYDNIDQVNCKSEHGKVFSFKEGKAKYLKGGY